MAFTIRYGGPDDVEEVLALWHRVADVLPSSTDDEPAVRALLARDPEALLLGEDDGRVVATVIVGWDGWREFRRVSSRCRATRSEGVGRRRSR